MRPPTTSDRATPEQRAKAAKSIETPLRLDQLEAEAREIFGGEADDWLDSANANLGGQTPREMLQGCNKEVVRELLDNIRCGVFS